MSDTPDASSAPGTESGNHLGAALGKHRLQTNNPQWVRSNQAPYADVRPTLSLSSPLQPLLLNDYRQAVFAARKIQLAPGYSFGRTIPC